MRKGKPTPPPVSAMTDRQELLLAYGIVEYSTALAHLDALRSVGVAVPYAVLGRLQAERRELVSLWSASHGDPQVHDPDTVAADAATWLAQHTDALDTALEEGRNDGDAEGGVI